MASNPEFYHHVLRDVFKGESEEVGEVGENAKVRARLSYSLLSHFSEIPGLSAQSLDSQALRAWIDAVRQLGAQTDRAAVTDNFIGRLLAHAPVDADDGWPHRAIRDELERVQSEELERGIQLERYNMRGVHGKELFEGGGQERALGKRKERCACRRLASHIPLLTAISKTWERDAEREDTEAAQRKLRS
jgi:hypothetical protein